MDLQPFQFQEKKASDISLAHQKPWKILSVEDDELFQAALSYSLHNFCVEDRPVHLLTASSASEAAAVLAEHEDISLILLDVIMETDDAGLRLVETIRNLMGNLTVRIVILTGQPGLVPREDVIRKYDINEYWDKTDIRDKLTSVITANLRSWQALRELEESRIGLQMVVDASRSLSNRVDINEFSQTVLTEISHILNLSPKEGGIICAISQSGSSPKIITACGRFSSITGMHFDELAEQSIKNLLTEVIRKKTHIIKENLSGFYFENHDSGISSNDDAYIMVVAEEVSLSQSHIRLLKVFAENVGTGFSNIYLHNRLKQLAFYDEETSLPNHNWFKRELSLLRADERAQAGLFLFCIKNHFIHHLHFGSQFSIDILKKIIAKLQEIVSDPDVIIRFSHDVIAVLCRDNDCLRNTKFNNTLDFEFDLNGIRSTVALNLIYINLHDFAESSPEDLLQTARSAIIEMASSNIRFTHYKPEKIQNTLKDFQLINRMGPALNNGEFYLVLQPKIDLYTECPIGFESLLRWRRPDGTMISPGYFIPVAEKSGTIQKIDIFVLKESVKLLKVLHDKGWDLPISFNATVSDLENQHYLETLEEVLSSNDIDVSLLELEVIESDAMNDYDKFESIFLKIRKAGMKIALDDFGTGYSSLQHLARIPANTIKIDQTFIRKMAPGNIEMHVIELVIRVARRLNFQLIAEGIETVEQAEKLRSMGCSACQGYLYAKPMPIEEVIDWLKNYDGQ